MRKLVAFELLSVDSFMAGPARGEMAGCKGVKRARGG